MITHISGSIGDILLALPCIESLARQDHVDILLEHGVPQEYTGHHPLKNIRMSKEYCEFLKPLLLSQDYINEVYIFDTPRWQAVLNAPPDNIVDLDLFRYQSIEFNQGPAQRWFLWSHAQNADITKPCLRVESSPVLKDTYIINRTARNINYFISYKGLEDLPLVFVGLDDEYEEMKKILPDMPRYKPKDALDLAQVMKGSKGFIGNQSFLFCLAESLKIPRLLEVPLIYANLMPLGGRCYEARNQKAWDLNIKNLTKESQKDNYEYRKPLPSVFYLKQELSACTQNRAILPSFFLSQKLRPYLNASCSELLPKINNHDVIIVQRVLKGSANKLLVDLQKQGKIVVYDTDDLLTQLDPTNPAYDTIMDPWVQKILKGTMELAHHITVTTKELKNRLGYSDKTYVLPNLIDHTTYILPERKEDKDAPVIILWSGSNSHHADLEELEAVYHALRKKYGPERFKLLIQNYLPHWCAEYQRKPGEYVGKPVSKYKNIGFVEAVLPGKYAHTLCQLKPDIGLCPLVDTPFNRCKSNLKWLEYSLAGAATVVADLPPYQMIKEGEDGCLVTPGNTQSWIEKISLLIEDYDLRRKIQENARKRVITEFSWLSKGTKPWERFILQVLKEI